jgi:methionyl-tRNA synthetase
MLYPFIPAIAKNIWCQLGIERTIEEFGFEGLKRWGLLREGNIGNIQPVYPRIE